MGSRQAAYKFHALRLLAVLGWPMSIRTLTLVGVSLGTVIVIMTMAISLLLLRLVRDALSVANGNEYGSATSVALTIALLALGVCLYIAVGALAREAFTIRRFAVRISPNRALYRANDVAMEHVFLFEAGPRAALLLGVSGSICFAAWTVIRELGLDLLPWTLVLGGAPFVVATCVLALSSWLAVRDPRMRGSAVRCAAATAGCVFGFVLGMMLAKVTHLLARPVEASAFQLNVQNVDVHWFGLAAGAPVIFFSVLTIRNLGFMRNQSFPVTATVPTPIRRKQTKRLNMSATLRRTLFVNITRDKSFTGFRGIGICLLLAAATFLGFCWASGQNLLPDVRGFQNVCFCLVFMICIVGSELMSKANNPIGLMPQLRQGWEAGCSAGSLVQAVILTQTLPLVALALPLALVVVASGMSIPSLATLLIPWGIATSNIIGNALSRVKVKQADGSMEMSLAAAFIALMLAVPVLGLCLLGNVPAAIAAVVYTTLLTGGAKICLQRRILSQR